MDYLRECMVMEKVQSGGGGVENAIPVSGRSEVDL